MSNKKTIDLYLIGGQSNAAGCSLVGNLNQTFQNVGYAGGVDYYFATNTFRTENLSFESFNWSVTAGLGSDERYIGPEYGMAKVLTPYYSKEKPAFIFKDAGGATALLDYPTDENPCGNWYPRSFWKDGYTPCADRKTLTGVQYYRFVTDFERVYSQLKQNGYAPIIKGMAWMQGEADLGKHNEYEAAIKALISDLREDLVKITGDKSLIEMPIVIGEIATTFAEWNNPLVPPFIEMQRKVARDMKNVATIETADLILMDENNQPVGTDKYHFNSTDAETLGIRFAKKLIEICEIK